MESLNVSEDEDHLIIKIDKNELNDETYSKVMNHLRLEYLIKKADLDNSIDNLGEEIKSNWWNKNESNIINRIYK